MSPNLPPGYSPGGGGQTDSVAIVSLVLGILSWPLHFCCYLGWPAGIASIVCGIVAISRIKASQDRIGGRGLAIGGIASSILGFLMIVGIFVLYGAAIMISGM